MNKFLWPIPFISFIAGYFIMDFLYKSHTTQAPALVGKPVHEALNIAATRGLSLRLIKEQEDPKIPFGTILSQNPLPGTHMKGHQPIGCIVSKQTTAKTPPYTGQLESTIITEAEKNGIKTKIYPINSAAPVHVCVAQDPAAGNPMTAQSLTIYTSQGSAQQFLFPNLCQKNLDEVKSFLENAPVSIQIISGTDEDTSSTQASYIVYDQHPKQGTIVQLDPEKPIKIQLMVTSVVEDNS